MFFAGKVLALLTQPLGWVAVLLLIGLVLPKQRQRLARGFTGMALLLLLLLGWLPLPDYGIRTLEARYPQLPAQADLGSYAGVVLLGGALESGRIVQAHGSNSALNDGAERMTAAIGLLRQNPHLRIVFTGGEGALLGSGPPESARTQALFQSMGVPDQAVQYESASRTTYENAVLSSRLPGIDKSQRWLLLTSAWHMPRAMGTFSKDGWNVTAYPVDFRTGSHTPWTEYSLRDGVGRWQLLLHELLGTLSYRLAGRI